MTDLSFSSLALSRELIDNLATLGFAEMTPIQAQSLPPVLNGEDLIGKAKTGSGKTVAFGLGVLKNVDVDRFRIQALILCPTRELADQVATELRKLARATHNLKILTLCGGSPFGPQAKSLQHGAHIIVGTPGRVEDHLRKGNLPLNNVNTFVLDEADRMLDSGFQDALDEITRHIPSQRQTLLFSATYPPKIQAIAERIMHSPTLVDVAETHQQSSIEQLFYRVDDEQERITALRTVLLHYRPQSTLVFCNTKAETVKVASALNEQGFSSLALHGDLDQKDRDKSLTRFANKSVSICVATDVAARGLDIDELDAVINYQLARELAVHTHRIGRTGRAGAKGIALTLATTNEQFKINKLQELQTGTGSSIGIQSDHFTLQALPSIDQNQATPFKPQYATLIIDGGKKHKLRAGDILGALTANNSISGSDIGKIKIFNFHAYVAVNRKVASDALSTLSHNKLKGKISAPKKLHDHALWLLIVSAKYSRLTLDSNMHILGDLSVDQFLKDYWQKKPVLIRNAFESFEPLISAQELAGLSLEEEIESRIIIEEPNSSGSQWMLKKGPFHDGDFAALPKEKWTLLVQAVDHWLPEAADLLEHFRFIPAWRIDDLMISYATNGGSVGPHFDQYDVFLLQAEGQRQWHIGQQCDEQSALVPDIDLQILQAFQKQESWVLNPGDMLYVPPKVAHWGVAQGECQTYSIGFRAPAASQLLDRMLDETLDDLTEFDRYEDPQLAAQASSSEITHSNIAAIKDLLIKQLDNDAAVASMLGHLMTEAKYPEYAPAIDYDEAANDTANWPQIQEALLEASRNSPLTRHEHARFSYFIDESSSKEQAQSQSQSQSQPQQPPQHTEKPSEPRLLFFFQGEQAILQQSDLALVKMLGDQRYYDANDLISAATNDATQALLTLLWNSELIYAPEEDD